MAEGKDKRLIWMTTELKNLLAEDLKLRFNELDNRAKWYQLYFFSTF